MICSGECLLPNFESPPSAYGGLGDSHRNWIKSWGSGHIWLPVLREEGERDLNQIEGARSSLYNVLKLATGGGEERATRSLEEDTDPVVRDWTTDEVVFHITA